MASYRVQAWRLSDEDFAPPHPHTSIVNCHCEARLGPKERGELRPDGHPQGGHEVPPRRRVLMSARRITENFENSLVPPPRAAGPPNATVPHEEVTVATLRSPDRWMDRDKTVRLDAGLPARTVILDQA